MCGCPGCVVFGDNTFPRLCNDLLVERYLRRVAQAVSQCPEVAPEEDALEIEIAEIRRVDLTAMLRAQLRRVAASGQDLPRLTARVLRVRQFYRCDNAAATWRRVLDAAQVSCALEGRDAVVRRPARLQFDFGEHGRLALGLWRQHGIEATYRPVGALVDAVRALAQHANDTLLRGTGFALAALAALEACDLRYELELAGFALAPSLEQWVLHVEMNAANLGEDIATVNGRSRGAPRIEVHYRPRRLLAGQLASFAQHFARFRPSKCALLPEGLSPAALRALVRWLHGDRLERVEARSCA